MSTSEGKTVLAQGRIVWVSGDLFRGKAQTEFGSAKPKLNQAGEQTMQYGFGLAISKVELADPVKGALWVAMHEESRAMFPSGQIPPSFAMKYKDGDGVDDQGRPFALREGHAGCLIFALTTSLPLRFFRWEGGQNVQVADGIKCGDYVNVQVTVKAHAAIGQGKAGLYLNPMAVQLVAPGKEIINAPSGDVIFGAPPAAPANYVPPVQPTMPVVPPAGATPLPPAAPHYAVVPPAFQPPTAQYPAVPTMPSPGGFPPIPGR